MGVDQVRKEGRGLGGEGGAREEEEEEKEEEEVNEKEIQSKTRDASVQEDVDMYANTTATTMCVCTSLTDTTQLP